MVDYCLTLINRGHHNQRQHVWHTANRKALEATWLSQVIKLLALDSFLQPILDHSAVNSGYSQISTHGQQKVMHLQAVLSFSITGMISLLLVFPELRIVKATCNTCCDWLRCKSCVGIDPPHWMIEPYFRRDEDYVSLAQAYIHSQHVLIMLAIYSMAKDK